MLPAPSFVGSASLVPTDDNLFEFMALEYGFAFSKMIDQDHDPDKVRQFFDIALGNPLFDNMERRWILKQLIALQMMEEKDTWTPAFSIADFDKDLVHQNKFTRPEAISRAQMSQTFDSMFELWPAVVEYSCYYNYALVLTEILSLGKHVRIKYLKFFWFLVTEGGIEMGDEIGTVLQRADHSETLPRFDLSGCGYSRPGRGADDIVPSTKHNNSVWEVDPYKVASAVLTDYVPKNLHV